MRTQIAATLTLIAVLLSGCAGSPLRRPDPGGAPQIGAVQPGAVNAAQTPAPGGPAPPVTGPAELGRAISVFVAGLNGVNQSVLYAPGQGGNPAAAGVHTVVIDDMAFIGLYTFTAKGKTTGGAWIDPGYARNRAGSTVDPGDAVSGSQTTLPPAYSGMPTLRTGLVDAVQNRVRTAFPQIRHVYVTADPPSVTRLAKMADGGQEGAKPSERLRAIFDVALRLAREDEAFDVTRAGR